MANRKKRRAQDAQIAFEALSVEGGLLSPDWLAKVAQLSAKHQAETDYRVPKGLTIRDEIGRYWRMARATWADLSAGLEGGTDRQALTEATLPALLQECFGFSTLKQRVLVREDEQAFPVSHMALGRRVPVVLAPAGVGLDTLLPELGDGHRRRSAFGLVQEYLNYEDAALWGLATDGLNLRILRDNDSLTRPAWIEADLARIFTEERYADFAALWLLCHETRFGRPDQPVTDCALETWRNAGLEQGTRAREHLRHGVEEALLALGQGFLTHPDNHALRAALQDGSLDPRQYNSELLRLVYRLIFLLTVEERALLHPRDADEGACALYAEGYGMRRLRDRSARRSAHDRFSDLWEAQKIVLRGLAAGELRLGLPALAGLFLPGQCPTLDAARLGNRALLLAVFRLSWLREPTGLVRVNWRDMGPEELGSVYESLLELVPQITGDGRQFTFASGGETRGNARKTSGSYYTPDSQVQVLLDSALDPVISDTIAKNPGNPVPALLSLTIVDPACGSGHFLLAAARRLAAHVARLQAGGTPSAGDYRRALRQVVARCIFGVDLNPMAVELCKVALWMEALEPGLPLTFLKSHIQHGNALLGTTPEAMANGIPDDAWKPIEGDDKKTASALRKRNKKAAAGQRGLEALWATPDRSEVDTLSRAVTELDAALDTDPKALAQKDSRWAEILASPEYRHQKLVADAWCAAFVWPKQDGELAEAAPTNDLWRQIRDGQGEPPALTVKTVGELAGQYSFFHWPLQFPQVFASGGFDVVLGNPPWEQVELKEQEWFAERSPAIAEAPNAAARKKMIARLVDDNPNLYSEYSMAARQFAGQNQLARATGRFALCARGRINTFALFAEHNRGLLSPAGRAGFIVPTGIATDDSTKEFFATMINGQELASFYSFENEEFIFPAVHHAFKFALLVIDRSGRSERSDLIFFARQTSALADKDRHFSLTPAEFALLNPNTHTCPTFRSRRDADLNLTIYRRAGILWREDDPDGNPWGLRFKQGLFNMASDSGLFRSEADLKAGKWSLQGNKYVRGKDRMLPLVEAKMVHHFDHRFGTYEGQSEGQANQGKLPELDDAAHADPKMLTLARYWVAEKDVQASLENRWTHEWLLGWRRICRSTDQRTFIPSLFPLAGVGDSEFLLLPDQNASSVACMYSNLSSYCFDYASRQKIGGTNASYHIVRQLPVLHPSSYLAKYSWAGATACTDWILLRALELTYTAWDLEPFAHDVDYDGPPFRWDPDRRFLLRAELDAAFFHLYGIKRDDVDYIMDTFPIVRKNNEKAHGEYRTKRVILEVYDAMAEAARTGRPYQTRLDPPPADPRVAHPDTRGEG